MMMIMIIDVTVTTVMAEFRAYTSFSNHDKLLGPTSAIEDIMTYGRICVGYHEL
jgi:hypothetical protein